MRTTYTLFFAILLLVVLTSCSKERVISFNCKAPYLLVGTECCLDANQNNICDKDENCNNAIKDQDETDVDCGGTKCKPCEAGKLCRTASDCNTTSCKNGVCVDEYCGNGVCAKEENNCTCPSDCGSCAGNVDPNYEYYCSDNICLTKRITPDYSYEFSMLPNSTVLKHQNNAQFNIHFQNNLNVYYYVSWSYNVCLESNLSYCPFNNGGSFILYANASNDVRKGVYWGTDVIGGIKQLEIYPGKYRIIFNTIGSGAPVGFAQNYSWTVS